ncbi:hypothetical protein Ahy_A02g008992 [Arachis hypogaea]|uniref:Uncharacterized protein n=1 Tax=Arachis hypogaea TaxID=3818 RepID=A0A445EG61_ARAHY|nr:hypothetical protein Ahy_A02g008992 [Arachis hypogaea]
MVEDDATLVPEPPTEIQLEVSQPPLSQTDDSQEVLPPPVRPPKLPPKKKSSKQEKATPGSSFQAATTPPVATPPVTTQPTTLPPSHPMQGASQGTGLFYHHMSPYFLPEFYPPKETTHTTSYLQSKPRKFGQPTNAVLGLESVADHRSTGLDPHAHYSGRRASLFLFILLMMLPNDLGLLELPAALLALAITSGVRR